MKEKKKIQMIMEKRERRNQNIIMMGSHGTRSLKWNGRSKKYKVVRSRNNKRR